MSSSKGQDFSEQDTVTGTSGEISGYGLVHKAVLYFSTDYNVYDLSMRETIKGILMRI